ncbi:hypothetical protein D3C71_1654490 [compost metagenome]
MPRRDDKLEGIVVENRGCHSRTVANQIPDAYVDKAVLDMLINLRGGHGLNRCLDKRKLVLEVGKNARQNLYGDGCCRTEYNMPLWCFVQIGEPVLEVVDNVHDLLRMRKEHLAFIRQRNRLVTVDQLGLELFLKAFDLRGDRRLGQIQQLSRLAEAHRL